MPITERQRLEPGQEQLAVEQGVELVELGWQCLARRLHISDYTIQSEISYTHFAMLVPAETRCPKASAPFLIVEEEILGNLRAPDSSSSLRWGAAAAWA